MNRVVYRKSDLTLVGTLVAGMTDIQEINISVIPNFGGKEEDYDSLDVPFDYFRLEEVNGEVVALELEPPAPESEALSETDALLSYVVDVDYRLTMMELGM